MTGIEKEIPHFYRDKVGRAIKMDSIYSAVIHAKKIQQMFWANIDGYLYEVYPGGRNVNWGRIGC